MGARAPIADWVTIADLHTDPFPIFGRLRAEGGVHWVPAVGRYLVTSYAAVRETAIDQDTYSANEEGSLHVRAMGHSMLGRDDPEHHLERTAWQPALRPGAVQRIWTATFQRNADKCFDRLVAAGPGADLVQEFAAPYAAENLREIIGLHNASQQDLQRWAQTMTDAAGAVADDPVVRAAGRRSFDEVDAALDELLPWHAAHPNQSLLSTLLRLPGYSMPVERIRANVKMTIGAGLTEPRDAIGVTAWALLTHPEQRAASASDPSLWHAAFEEAIRWVAPVGMYPRQVTRDTVLAGVELPAGAKLGICVLSANRDETVWPDAAAFDLRREVEPHLAFGKGVHTCLGAWVARAEVADIALPMLFRRLDGLRVEGEAQMRGWVSRGMTALPVGWSRVAEPAPASTRVEPVSDAAPRIAIVGSGPAGSFSAQALRRTFPAAEIDVIDELPTPYGLVRYGVAADHQGMKSVTRQFDRLFTAEGVRFHGNVRIGADVPLSVLRQRFDAVVIATGMHADPPLPVPGGDLDGVHGAGRITRLLNTHPDETDLVSLGTDVVVVGHGNVAMDIVRLLARDGEGLSGSDVSDTALAALAGDVRTLHVVGRSAVPHAKFDPVLVREIAGLPGIRHVVHGLDELPATGRDARVDAVHALAAASVAPGAERLTVEWRFGLTPAAVLGDESVEGMEFEAGRGSRVTIPATGVITAIGFGTDPGALVDPGTYPDGRAEPGLYVAGWLRRGPRGSIPDQRLDARALARLIADDIAAGRIVPGRAPGWAPTRGEVDFDGWRRIDLRERLGSAPDREREKLPTRAEQLETARDQGIVLPQPDGSGLSDLAAEGRFTILFGTESGGAEFVASELRDALGPAADVRVHDLAGIAPGDLDVTRTHLLVCSTYGDGEVPTLARPFHQALAAGGVDLTGLAYAVFGMGDRSYAKTYSRGSELLDEALAARGAERFGEYGRHDAGGAMCARDAAVEWLQGVLADLAVRA